MDPVLICGGGIGGLSAAIALAREGVPVRVLEQAASFSEAGAGIEIGPNSSRLLEAWNVLEMMSTFVSEPGGMKIYNGLDGSLLTTVPLGSFAREHYGAPYLVIHRRRLQHCLLEAARNHDGIEIETSFKLAGFETSDTGVTATSEAGGTAHGRALIGADGIWSTVRKSFTSDEPHTVGVTAWRAVLPIADAPDIASKPFIGAHLGPGAHVLHYPVDAGTSVNIVAMIEETIHFDGWASPGASKDLLPFFNSWDEQIFELLKQPEDWFKWTVMSMEPLPRWGDGPVTMIGDAAHPIQPFMAQGGAAAIEDAAALAAAVTEHPQDMAAAFRVYESARQARTTRIQRASQQRGRLYHMSGPARWMRDQIVRHRRPETLLMRYDWLYGRKDPA